MNRIFVRRAAIGLGILLTLVVIAGAVFTATFDVNRYKPQIVAAVQERTGRTLRFEGDLSLSVFPRVAVELPATTLSEPGRDAVFARLKSGQASVALMPLLRSRLEVDSVRVDGLQATLVRQKDGRTNIDDLLGRKDTAGGKPGPAAEAPGATIGAVQMNDAELTVRDLAAGRTVRLQEVDLRVGRVAPGARTPIDAEALVTADTPALSARVSVDAELEWTEQGGLRAVRDLAVKIDGSMDKQPIALDAKAERLVTGPDVLDVRGLRLSASRKAEGGAALEVQANAPRVDIGQGKAAGERIEVTVARRGPQPLEAKAVIEGLRGTAERLEATGAKLSGTSRAGQRTTRFDLAAVLTASVTAKTAKIERASGEVVIEDPALAQKTIRLPVVASGSIDGQRETVALQFDTRGEGLVGRGRLNVSGFGSPRFAFDVDAEQVDLDRHFPAATKDAGVSKGTPPGGGAPAADTADGKVDLAALRGLNATGTVRIARLRARGTDFADVRAAVKAADGRLEVAPFGLRVHGGAINGRLGVDSRGNRVTANGTVNGLQLRRAVTDIAGRAALEGSANGTFDLAAAGGTTAQMKRGLNGTLAVDVRDGALVGIDLADVIGTASGFLQSRGRQTGAFDDRKRTPFSQLSASIRIKDGVAVNDDLQARSPQFDIAGSGRMDLVSTELDYVLRTQVLAGPATERTPLRSLAGISVPVRIAGQVDKPSYAVDWGSVATDALLKRATGRAGAPAVDQVIEGLGDLLGRRRK